MIRLVQAYFTEAQWLSRNYIPAVEEHMALGIVTSGYYLLTTASFIGMGCIATEEIFQWITNNPKIVHAAAIICRLMDDIVSNEVSTRIYIYDFN
jgi:hypothetical protein